MANLPRSAKSGGDWTVNELRAYNISVVDQSVQEFFGISEAEIAARPLPVSQTLLTAESMPSRPPASKQEVQFFSLMLDAQANKPVHVDEFVAFLLDLLGYDELPEENETILRVIRSHTEMGFLMCGMDVSATPDVAVQHRWRERLRCVLLVQEDKVRPSYHRQRDMAFLMILQLTTCGKVAWPQLIAAAIAAYSENQYRRVTEGLPPQLSCIIPGITMAGTWPTFYKIPVTSALLTAVETGQYPSEPTVVERCIVPVPDPSVRPLGLQPVVNRKFLFQCFDAFKSFMVNVLLVQNILDTDRLSFPVHGSLKSAAWS
jgi:hypothetical protein